MKIGVPWWKASLLFIRHVGIPFLATPFAIAMVVRLVLRHGK